MKTNPDQMAGPESTVESPTPHEVKTPMLFHVPPPARRKSWFGSYDEEWAAFVARHGFKKTAPGLDSEPQSPPRVWNEPHY